MKMMRSYSDYAEPMSFILAKEINCRFNSFPQYMQFNESIVFGN